jgi:hypothetical protein
MGGGVASRSRNQAHKANSLVVYIYFAPNLFFWVAAAAARISGNPSGDYQIFELFCVGGTVATKRGFRQCAPRDFPLRWYANDAPRRASRWDPTTHLYHIICFILFTGLYKLFGKKHFCTASSSSSPFYRNLERNHTKSH